MKRFITLLLAASMMLAVFSGCGEKEESASSVAAGSETQAGSVQIATGDKIALITDFEDIDDNAFNQTCWEAVQAYGEANGVACAHYKPSENTTNSRVLSITQAVGEGATVVVMPGYLFGEVIGLTQDQFPNVKFIAVDVGESDLVGTTLSDNTYAMVFREEQAGYLAGYAAVKEGYTKLGFLGGLDIPGAQRYGFGYIQGINAGAEELGVDVEIKYTYGNQSFGDANITAKMEDWYSSGTEVVFACGGTIYTSAVEAANKHSGKVIGVDVDQSYIDPCIITSAIKGLYSATYSALETYFGGQWDTVGGTLANLSLAEGDYAGLPTDPWSLQNFTVGEYEAQVAGIRDGSIPISDNIRSLPAVGTHVTLTIIS